MSLNSPLAPFAHRRFRLLALGQLSTTLGNAIAPLALAFAVIDLNKSASSLGLVLATRSATTLAFLLFGGIVADRWSRTFIVTLSCAVSAATQGFVALLVLTRSATLAKILVCSALSGLSTAASSPASSALLPQTVPSEVRKQAVVTYRFISNSALVLGAGAGGLLIGRVGPGWGFACDALSFALAGVCFWLIRVPANTRLTAEGSTIIGDLMEGWSEFVHRRWVCVMVIGFMLINAVTGAVYVLGPGVADRTIGRSLWGFVVAAGMLGMAFGGFLAMSLRVKHFLFFGAASLFTMAINVAALALVPRFTILVTTAFAAGVGMEVCMAAWETSLQHHIPIDRLARIYSFDTFGSCAAMPIGQMMVVPLSILLGVRGTLLGAAAVVVLAVLWMTIPASVRRLEHWPVAGSVPLDSADLSTGDAASTS